MFMVKKTFWEKNRGPKQILDPRKYKIPQDCGSRKKIFRVRKIVQPKKLGSNKFLGQIL